MMIFLFEVPELVSSNYGLLVFINFQNCFIQSIIELEVSSIVNIENKYFDKHLVENISVPVPVKFPVPVTIPVPAKSRSRHFLPIPVPAEKAIPVDHWCHFIIKH